jgi:hypothetical protein
LGQLKDDQFMDLLGILMPPGFAAYEVQFEQVLRVRTPDGLKKWATHTLRWSKRRAQGNPICTVK